MKIVCECVHESVIFFAAAAANKTRNRKIKKAGCHSTEPTPKSKTTTVTTSVTARAQQQL